MESKVPLPTDNIFKFYALFGLILIIFGFSSVIYVNRSTNNLAFEIAVEYEILKSAPARTLEQEVRFKVLQKKFEIAKKDKAFFLLSLSFILTIGIIMMGYGFRKWHTQVQPIQDEMARLTLEKLRNEVKK